MYCKIFTFLASPPVTSSASVFAAFSNTPVGTCGQDLSMKKQSTESTYNIYGEITSIAMTSMTVHQLNMSWTVAAEKALRNSSLSPTWAKETIVFVTEVPMLAPKTMGTASCGLRTRKPNYTIKEGFHILHSKLFFLSTFETLSSGLLIP